MRLRCSLRWIAGMLQREPSNHEAIPLLLDPYTSEGRRLSFTVVLTLSNPVLYTTVLSTILGGERGYDFSTLVHTLARHGVYLVDDDGAAVNHSMLSQTSPFNESSHIAVMEGLMSLYSWSIVTLPQIVNTVRGISKLVASKDLPSGLSEGLLLWLNKVSQSVLETQRQSHTHREFNIPPADNLSTSLCDGQCLGALLIYYAPNNFRWTDFHFGKHPLTEQQASENLSKAIDFLSKHMTAPGFHITEEMLLRPDDNLHANFQVLMAHLYHELQVKGLTLTSTTHTPSQHTNVVEQSASRTKLLGRLDEHYHSNSDTTLPQQRTHATVFTAPLRQSLARLIPLKSKSSHELITADSLPTERTQPQTSLSRARKANSRPVELKARESWHEEKPEQVPQKPTQFSVDLSGAEDVRRSFTVDTTQTLPSAIAAGLPVVESSTPVLSSEESGHSGDQPEAYQSSSPESACQVIRLEVAIEDCPSTNPSPLIEKLLTVYEKIKERHTASEQDEGTSRQRVAQKVLETIAKHSSPVSKNDNIPETVESLSKFPAFSPITPVDLAGHIVTEKSGKVSHQTQEASQMLSDASPEANRLPRQLSVTFCQTGIQKANPWDPHSITATTQDELLRQQREQQVRDRLEERERTRRANQEKRRKAAATQRVIKELIEPEAAVEHQATATHQLPEAPPSNPLSDKPSEFLSHNGPGLYVPPPAKSNKKLIKNAISYVCLAGDANLTLKQRALAGLESSSASHVMILFRDIIGFKFRGLYSYSPDSGQVNRIFGSGPKVIKCNMVAHLYKYNSGRKEFRQIPSHTFSVSIDALTIQPEYWAKKSRHR